MLAMSDEDSRKSSSPQRTKSAVSGSANESKQAAHDKKSNENNSVKPNMVYIVSYIFSTNFRKIFNHSQMSLM